MSVDRNNIIARPCDGGSDQEWTNWSNNLIMNNESGLCLGLQHDDNYNDWNVVTEDCFGTKDQ